MFDKHLTCTTAVTATRDQIEIVVEKERERETVANIKVAVNPMIRCEVLRNTMSLNFIVGPNVCFKQSIVSCGKLTQIKVFWFG